MDKLLQWAASVAGFVCNTSERIKVLACGGVLLTTLYGCGVPGPARADWDQLVTSYKQLRSASGNRELRQIPDNVATVTGPVMSDDWGAPGRVEVTVHSKGETWSAMVDEVCRQADLSVILPGDNDEGQNVGDVVYKNIAAQVALDRLAEMRDLRARYRDGVVSFVPRSSSSVAVVSSGYATTDEAAEVTSAVAGQDAEVRKAGSYLFVSGDEETVERVTELDAVLGRVPPAQWLLSVWVVELQGDIRQKLGVELAFEGDLSQLITGSGAELMSRFLLSATIEGNANSRWAHLMTRGSLVMIEGTESSLRAVERVPIPRRTVSNFGTVEVSGYEYVEAGLIIRAKGQRIPGGLRLELNPELSKVTGFVEEAPIIASRNLSVTCMVQSGQWVVLAGLDDYGDKQSRDGLFGTMFTNEKSLRNVVVLMQALRVGERGQNVRVSSADSVPELQGATARMQDKARDSLHATGPENIMTFEDAYGPTFESVGVR